MFLRLAEQPADSAWFGGAIQLSIPAQLDPLDLTVRSTLASLDCAIARIGNAPALFDSPRYRKLDHATHPAEIKTRGRKR